METDAAETIDGLRYASWGRRLAAVAIDAVLLAIVVITTALAAGVTLDQLNEELRGEGGIVAVLLFVVPEAVYDTLMIGSRNQTFGKMAMKITVLDAGDGSSRIGYPRAFARWATTNLFLALWIVPGILDHLWPLRDRRRQTWHDKLVRSVVVRTP
jgi:uncharacterized RDD family membrane protein YckC